jgi:hypothetical protein
MTTRFQGPWRIAEFPNGFAVYDATGRQLGFFFGRADPNMAGHADFLMIDDARQIAVDFAMLPELLKQTSGRSEVVTSPEDDKLAKIQTSCSPEDAPEIRRLPRAAQLPAVAGLPVVEPPTRIPNAISLESDGLWMSTPLLHRPSDPFSSRTKFFIATATVALLAGYLISGNSDRPVEVAAAPQTITDIPPVELLSLREADATSAKTRDLTVEAKLDIQNAEAPNGANKPNANRHEDAKVLNGANELSDDAAAIMRFVMQRLRYSGDARATAGRELAGPLAADQHETESGIEPRPSPMSPEEGSFLARQGASTCFPSASAVRENHPGAWPSWTLRAPGHEGTRCWYAATRTTSNDHRSEMRRTETVQTMEKPQVPWTFGLQ